MKKLNIGCGKDVRKGWDNLDNHSDNGANIIWDLRNLPLSFKDNTYDVVYCSHVLEDFIDPLPLMFELIRITKINGIIEIRVPYETRIWNSLYHKRGFNITSFKHFPKISKDYGNNMNNIEILELKFYPLLTENVFGNAYRIFVSFFYNLLPSILIENTFLKYIFLSKSIKVIYKKIK